MLKRAGLVLLLLVACAASGVLAASVLAETPPPTTPTDTTTTVTTTASTTIPSTLIAPGITLGGVPIGGLTADAAVAAVEQAFGRPVLLRLDRTKISIAPDLLGLSLSVDSAVAKALSAAPDTALGLRATVNGKLVSAFVAKVAARFDRRPVDSRLMLRNFKPFVTKSAIGRRVDRGATVRQLTSQLVHGTRAPIAVPVAVLRPKVTERTIGPVIVIRRQSNLLTLYDGMRSERRFPVATGQTVYPTPLGRFQIVVKWRNPWWYPPASPWAAGEKPVPPGPGNPLGTRWMGLSAPGVGIHGTPEDGSIGYSLSHGCIRMHIPDAEWLFNHVNIGTPVFIVAR
jgi:lipoprotein-anchoring transpeptidase ErfK/SrfK